MTNPTNVNIAARTNSWMISTKYDEKTVCEKGDSLDVITTIDYDLQFMSGYLTFSKVEIFPTNANSMTNYSIYFSLESGVTLMKNSVIYFIFPSI